jgi:RNA polymerase sigma factor (sigma-70 family)
MGYAVLDAVREDFHLNRRKNTANTEIVELLKSREAKTVVSRSEWPAVEAAMNIAAALELLNPREREVIERRYYRDDSQAEIAVALSTSQGRVSQIEKAACAKMRGAFAGSVPATRYATAAA